MHVKLMQVNIGFISMNDVENLLELETNTSAQRPPLSKNVLRTYSISSNQSASSGPTVSGQQVRLVELMQNYPYLCKNYGNPSVIDFPEIHLILFLSDERRSGF